MQQPENQSPQPSQLSQPLSTDYNVANVAVVAVAASGNPATGDSPVYATIAYRVLPV